MIMMPYGCRWLIAAAHRGMPTYGTPQANLVLGIERA